MVRPTNEGWSLRDISDAPVIMRAVVAVASSRPMVRDAPWCQPFLRVGAAGRGPPLLIPRQHVEFAEGGRGLHVRPGTLAPLRAREAADAALPGGGQGARVVASAKASRKSNPMGRGAPLAVEKPRFGLLSFYVFIICIISLT